MYRPNTNEKASNTDQIQKQQQQAEAMTTEGFVFIRLWILIFVVTQMILTPCIYAGSKLLFRM